MTNRIFWVNTGKPGEPDTPMKFDFDTDHLAGGDAYPTYDAYFKGFTTNWVDTKNNPVQCRYVVQDNEPDENSAWIDGPLQAAKESV